MVEKPEAKRGGSGRNSRDIRIGAANTMAMRGSNYRESELLMEAVVERNNMVEAYQRVTGNKGSSGIDNMTVDDLLPYLKKNWHKTKTALLEDCYQPHPVIEVEIPKSSGGVRKLGIPIVMDRLICQSLHQVLEPIFDKDFSESSYGFRRGKSAHEALEWSRNYIGEGYRWVVDMDLEKFFDRVNHDVLMSRIARKVKDKRILRLIRRYLQAGIMKDGLEIPRKEGTPQGSPLSPLLSNIMLDELDKELERRGHRFCRYADDCNIYVKSERAGERVLESITHFLSKKLRLRVNKEKSSVGRPWKLKFLGYSTTSEKRPRLKASKESIKRLKGKLRKIFRMGRGRSLGNTVLVLKPLLRGWANYFKLSEMKQIFVELDGWIRRRLRCILWRQWKRTYTRVKKLMKRGLKEKRAWISAQNGRGAWWNAGASHMNEAFPKSYFDRIGLISLAESIIRIRNVSRTAVYGTVRTVV